MPGLLQQPQLDLAEALHEEQRQAMAERAAELRMEPRHASKNRHSWSSFLATEKWRKKVYIPSGYLT